MEIGTKLFNKVTGTYDLELVIVLFLGHFLHILTFQHRRIYIINIYFLGNIGCVILYVDVEKTFTITFRFFFCIKKRGEKHMHKQEEDAGSSFHQVIKRLMFLL